RRAGGRPSPAGKEEARRPAAHPARRRHDDRTGRARHGFRDESRRPCRGDGFRREALRRPTNANPRRRTRPRSLSRRGRVSPLLAVADLHVSYGKVEPVTAVSLDTPAGQIVTVIGPNGAGKSTLLAALMGLLPAKGRIRYQGADFTGLLTEERVRAGMCL